MEQSDQTILRPVEGQGKRRCTLYFSRYSFHHDNSMADNFVSINYICLSRNVKNRKVGLEICPTKSVKQISGFAYLTFESFN